MRVCSIVKLTVLLFLAMKTSTPILGRLMVPDWEAVKWERCLEAFVLLNASATLYPAEECKSKAIVLS